MGNDFARDAIKRRGAGSKPTTVRRLTPQEFSDLLAAAELSPSEFALLWHTEPRRVNAWLDGTDNIPFPISWALQLLQKPYNFAIVEQIVGSRSTAKPEYANRKRIHLNITGVRSSIEERLPEAERIADSWESEHPGESHAYRAVIDRYLEVADSKGIMNIRRQLDEFKSIAGQLGIGIDVNQEILRENAQFIEKIDQERRSRLAKQRKAAPALPSYRKK